LTVSGTAVINGINAAINNTYAIGGITIAGGTIKATSGAGIINRTGTLTIGASGGGVSTTSPAIQGTSHGVDSTTGFNFYDGITNVGYDQYFVTDRRVI
jgi:hypothetical protein